MSLKRVKYAVPLGAAIVVGALSGLPGASAKTAHIAAADPGKPLIKCLRFDVDDKLVCGILKPGPRGAKGATGATGAPAPSVRSGRSAPRARSVPSVPQGTQGPAGPTGATGADGAIGPRGPIGPTGATGGTGPRDRRASPVRRAPRELPARPWSSRATIGPITQSPSAPVLDGATSTRSPPAPRAATPRPTAAVGSSANQAAT